MLILGDVTPQIAGQYLNIEMTDSLDVPSMS